MCDAKYLHNYIPVYVSIYIYLCVNALCCFLLQLIIHLLPYVQSCVNPIDRLQFHVQQLPVELPQPMPSPVAPLLLSSVSPAGPPPPRRHSLLPQGRRLRHGVPRQMVDSRRRRGETPECHSRRHLHVRSVGGLRKWCQGHDC